MASRTQKSKSSPQPAGKKVARKAKPPRIKILFPKLSGRFTMAELQAAVEKVIAARQEPTAVEKATRKPVRRASVQR